jgi:hypothetical protein
MNYKKHYDLLIEKGKTRVVSDYTETHHIIPVCMGGTDDKINLVDLTPEEHFLAHQLLMKIYPDVRGLARATQLMTVHQTNSRTTNKLFGWIRRKCAKSMSEWVIEWQKENGHPKGMLGKTHSDNTKKQVAETVKRLQTEAVGVRVYTYNLDGTFYKEFRTISECAEHLNTSPSNVKYTAEGKFQHCGGKQIRYELVDVLPPYKNPHAGKVYEKVSCTYCNKEGSGPAMKRFHFDNCKYKK